VTRVESKWIDGGQAGVAYFEITADCSGGETDPARYFVKCYDKSRTTPAAHEAHLFMSMRGDVPCAPIFLGETFVGELRLLIFAGLPPRKPLPDEWARLKLDALARLHAVPLDEELTQAYLRTHPILTTRLTQEHLASVRPAVESPQEADQLERFLDAWARLRKAVDALPLVLTNPAVRRDLARVDAENRAILLSWSNWRIDTLGEASLLAGTRDEPADWFAAVLESRGQPPSERTRRVVGLAARLFELEDALHDRRLRAALDIMVEIVVSESLDQRVETPLASTRACSTTAS
jgi:hypothetical protein